VAHAHQAERAFSQVSHFSIASIAAAVAAIAIAAIISWSAFGSLDLDPPSVQAPNPALLEAEGRWELQRKLQSGDLDPLTRAQREWERQRLQLGAAFD